MWKYLLPLAGKCLHLETVVPNELLYSFCKNRFVRVPPWFPSPALVLFKKNFKKIQDGTPRPLLSQCKILVNYLEGK